MHNPLHILVTSAGAAPAVAVIKSLRQQVRYPVVIGAVDMQGPCVGGLLADWFETVPSGTDPAYIPRLLEVCRARQVAYVFPTIDEELPAWAQHRDELARRGITVFINPLECVEIAGDKHRTAAHCVHSGLAHPGCYAAADARSLPSQAFPLFGKPRHGRGGRDAQRLDNPGQLGDFLERHPDALIQEFVSGTEFTVDVLVDERGSLLAAVPKQRVEVKSGMATKSITRTAPAVVAFVHAVVRAFGVRGVANVQVMTDPRGCWLIEVNPKFAASLPLTVAAGVHLPLCLLELARGDFDHPTPLSFRPNLMMLRCWEEHFVEPSPVSEAGGS